MHDRKIPNPVVPAEYSGKWIVWTKDGMRIAGVGDSPEAAEADARKAGVTDVIIEFVPPADQSYIGNGE